MGLENYSELSTCNSCPAFDIRNYQRNGWNLWLLEFIKHVSLSFDTLPNSDKVDLLLKNMGPDAYFIFQSFNVDSNVTYEDLIRLFEDYFSPLFSRYKFFSRKQKANESFDEFADALTILSFPCQFGNLQGSLVRDIFVANLHQSFDKIQKKMLKEKDPTLSHLIIIAKNHSSTSDGISLLRHCNSTLPPSNNCWKSPVNLRDSMDKLNLSSDSTSKRGTSLDENVETVSRTSIESSSRSSNRVQTVKSGINSRLSKYRSASYKSSDESSSTLNGSKKHASKSDTSYNHSCDKLIIPEGTPKNVSNKCMTLSQALRNHELSNTHNNVRDESFDKRTVSEEKVIPTSEVEQSQSISPSHKSNDNSSNVLNKYKNEISNSDTTSDCHNCDKLNNAEESSKTVSNKRMTLSQALRRHELLNAHEHDRNKSDDKTVSVVTMEEFRSEKTRYRYTNDRSDEFRDEGTGSKEKITPCKVTIEHNKSNSHNFPLPRDTFETVVVVYIPEGGKPVHVCQENKICLMQEIESELDELATNNLLGKVDEIEHNTKYAAPWQEHWYRAEVIAVQYKQQTVTAYFCDYGNTEDMLLDDLRRLPDHLRDLETLGFPIRLTDNETFPTVKYSSRLRVKPKFFDKNKNLVIELESE